MEPAHLKPQSKALPERKHIPRWLPISLLAVSTIALTVPILLLQRHRAAARLKSPPPPRRASTAQPRFSTISQPSVVPPTTSYRSATSNPAANSRCADDFNPALYTAKAFGLATFFVGVGALATVWGIQTALGVRDTQEFAERMRKVIATRMPALSSRIHRSWEEEDGVMDLDAGDRGGDEKWSWPA